MNKLFESLREKIGLRNVDERAKKGFVKKIRVSNYKDLSYKERVFSFTFSQKFTKSEDRNNNLQYVKINGENKSISYKGKKTVLYRKNQKNNDIEYKYHVIWCSHLDEVNNEGQIENYSAWGEINDNLLVNIYDKHSHKLIEENIKKRMNVCKLCLKELNYKNYKNVSYFKKMDIYRTFNLKEFFDNYSSNFKSLDFRNSNIQELNIYPDDWKEISLRFRALNNWICSDCKEDFSKEQWKLQVHHIDSQKFNVLPDNLMCLCEECHKKRHR